MLINNRWFHNSVTSAVHNQHRLADLRQKIIIVESMRGPDDPLATQPEGKHVRPDASLAARDVSLPTSSSDVQIIAMRCDGRRLVSIRMRAASSVIAMPAFMSYDPGP
jgi:hypothetical protein